MDTNLCRAASRSPSSLWLKAASNPNLFFNRSTFNENENARQMGGGRISRIKWSRWEKRLRITHLLITSSTANNMPNNLTYCTKCRWNEHTFTILPGAKLIKTCVCQSFQAYLLNRKHKEQGASDKNLLSEVALYQAFRSSRREVHQCVRFWWRFLDLWGTILFPWSYTPD